MENTSKFELPNRTAKLKKKKSPTKIKWWFQQNTISQRLEMKIKKRILTVLGKKRYANNKLTLMSFSLSYKKWINNDVIDREKKKGT